MANTKPRFQIEVLHDREITQETLKRNPHKDDHKSEHYGQNFIREVETRVVPESYMVYFPGGHSVWYETKADMALAGIVEDANFEVDMETGLPVDPKVIVNLKAHVEKNTRHRKAV